MRISAWNAITAFGGLEQTWRSLLDGKVIADHARGPIPGTCDRAFRLARDVVAAPGFQNLPPDTALIVGTSKGPIENWLHPPTSDNPPGGISMWGIADLAARLGEHLNLSGPRLTVSAACASGVHALVRGAMMIQRGECSVALIVATESSLHPLFVESFRRLGVIAKPLEGSRPFDVNRKGFLISEAAAAVLLRSGPASGLEHPTIGLEGFALGGDASHLTGVDPQARLLKHLLTRVLADGPVDLIQAHGTGTQQNDAAELTALGAVVGLQDPKPILWSHKAALGHSLGASGLLSVVLNCQCHSEGHIPPNPNTTQPMEARKLVIPIGVTERKVRRSLVLATGFGGPTAVVSLVST